MGNTRKTNLKKIASKQRQAIRIIDSDIVRRTTKKMEKLKILNIYKIIFTNLSYSCLELITTSYHMCFMKGLWALAISTQLGLGKTILLNVK